MLAGSLSLRRLIPMFLLGAALATGVSTKAQSQGELPPPAKHDFDRWEKSIADFEKADRENPPKKPGGIVFVGSSTMRLWKTDALLPDLRVINRGFGGSEMIDTRHFADRLVTVYKPKVVLVYAGSNDLAKGASPIRVHNDFMAFAKQVHQELPETEIVFLSIKPTVRRWPINHRIRATNALIEAACLDGERLHFFNVYPEMLNAEGLPEEKYLAKDGLHLNDAGYDHLTAYVRPLLERLLQDETSKAKTAP